MLNNIEKVRGSPNALPDSKKVNQKWGAGIKKKGVGSQVRVATIRKRGVGVTDAEGEEVASA